MPPHPNNQRELSPEMQDLLRRNGMRAVLTKKDDVYYIAAKNHDTPAITYAVTPSQLEALTARGSRQADREAFLTFSRITGRDFRAPSYSDAIRNYGRSIYLNPPRGLVMLPERRDEMIWNTRREEPGITYHDQRTRDMRAERRGFYRREDIAMPVQDDLMRELEQTVFVHQEPVSEKLIITPLNELVTNDVSFSDNKWQESLTSHGITIDATAKTMTVQAQEQPTIVYDLRDEELKALTAGSLAESSYENRINTINAIIADDYTSRLTIDMLNERKAIDLTLREGVAIHEQREEHSNHQGEQLYPVLAILIEPLSKDKNNVEAKYKMTAVINGESITHEINQKQLDTFKATDDYHRALLFNRIFKEVDKDIDVTTELDKALTHSLPSQQSPEIYASHQEESKEEKKSIEPTLNVQALASQQFDLAMENEQKQGVHLSRS